MIQLTLSEISQLSEELALDLTGYVSMGESPTLEILSSDAPEAATFSMGVNRPLIRVLWDHIPSQDEKDAAESVIGGFITNVAYVMPRAT